IGAEVFNARELRLPIGHLTLSTMMAASDEARRRHVARALMEGLAFALRANVTQVLGVSGTTLRAVRLGGGMTPSALGCQLVADVVGAPVHVPATCESGGVGAAMCAGVGVGLFASFAEAATALAKIAHVHEPRAEHCATYERLHEQWLDLRAAREAS